MPLSAEDAKKELISTLMTEARGMTARQLYGNFRELVGEIIPFARFGYSSIEEYMRSFPDVVRISRSPSGEETYSVIATQNTQHIAAMKRCERTKKARHSRPIYPRHRPAILGQWRPLPPRLHQETSVMIPPLNAYPYHPRPAFTPLMAHPVPPRMALEPLPLGRPRPPFVLMPGTGLRPLPAPPPVFVPVPVMRPSPLPYSSGPGHLYGSYAAPMVYGAGDHPANFKQWPNSITPAPSSSTNELKQAVVEVLQSHHYGLMDTELVSELVKKFPHLTLPEHLLALVDDWTDILDITSVPSKDARILALRLDYAPAAVVTPSSSGTAVHQSNGRSKTPDSAPGVLLLPQADEWNIYVCCVNASTDVIVRLVGEGYSDCLDELELELSEELEGSTSLGGSVTVNSVCALRALSENGEAIDWYRVRVTNIEEGQQARVTLVDHGGYEVVSTSCLYHLPASFLILPFQVCRGLCVQAISCKLTGLEDYCRCTFMTDTLIDRTVGKTLVANVDDRVGQVSLTLWYTSEDAKEEDVNINEVVLEMLRDSEQPPTLPKVSDSVEVTVSHVTASGDIYVQLVGPNMVRLRHVMAELEEYYCGKMTDELLFVRQPVLGDVYVVQSGAEFMRAKVTKVMGKRSEVEVFYVDFGDTDTVSLLVVRHFAPDLKSLCDFPHQAIRCQSGDYPPSCGLWCDEVKVKVMQLLPHPSTCWLEVLDFSSDCALIDLLVQDPTNKWLSIFAEVFGDPQNNNGPTVCGDDEGIYEEISAFLSAHPAASAGAISTPASASLHTTDAVQQSSSKAPKAGSGDGLVNIADALRTNLRISVPAPTSSSTLPPPPSLFGSSEESAVKNSQPLLFSACVLEPPASGSVAPSLIRAPAPGLSVAPCSVTGLGPTGNGAAITVKPLPKLPATEKLVTGDRVTVTWVVNPGHIVLTKLCNKPLVGKMHADMSRLEAEQMLSVHDVWPGVLVAVYVSEEQLWFRAVVEQLSTSMKGSVQVKVFLVDYGDHEVVALSNVRSLPAQFASLPPQGICTCLAGVRPVGGCTWTAESVSWLVQQAQGKEMEVHLPSSRGLHLRSDTSLPVHLVDNGHFIHELLVNAGHAVTGDAGHAVTGDAGHAVTGECGHAKEV